MLVTIPPVAFTGSKFEDHRGEDNKTEKIHKDEFKVVQELCNFSVQFYSRGVCACSGVAWMVQHISGFRSCGTVIPIFFFC